MNKPYDAQTLLGDKEEETLRTADLFMANTLPGVEDEGAPTYVEEPQGELLNICKLGRILGSGFGVWGGQSCGFGPRPAAEPAWPSVHVRLQAADLARGKALCCDLLGGAAM